MERNTTQIAINYADNNKEHFALNSIKLELLTVVKVDRRIRWHYTTTILRLRIGARLTRYRNCKIHNFARTISRHADGISRYSVPPSAGPLLPLTVNNTDNSCQHYLSNQGLDPQRS